MSESRTRSRTRPQRAPTRPIPNEGNIYTYAKRPRLHQQHFNSPKRAVKRPRLSRTPSSLDRQQTLTQLFDPTEDVQDSELESDGLAEMGDADVDADTEEPAMLPPKSKKRKRGKFDTKTESQNTLTQLNFVNLLGRPFPKEEDDEDDIIWRVPESPEKDERSLPARGRTESRKRSRPNSKISKATSSLSPPPTSTKERTQRRRVALSSTSGNSAPPRSRPPTKPGTPSCKKRKVAIQSPEPEPKPLTPIPSSPTQRDPLPTNNTSGNTQPSHARIHKGVVYIPDSEDSEESPFSSPEKQMRRLESWEQQDKFPSSSPGGTWAGAEGQPAVESAQQRQRQLGLAGNSTRTGVLPYGDRLTRNAGGRGVVADGNRCLGGDRSASDAVAVAGFLRSSRGGGEGSESETVLVPRSQQDEDFAFRYESRSEDKAMMDDGAELLLAELDYGDLRAGVNVGGFRRRCLAELLSEWMDDTVIPLPPMLASDAVM
ncbi:hypothetical protein P152DRAFT_462556 [Eremomyces bilateralis CBS 781.70]|uniref:Uncharacterized protein n=1 Tax=Eremomyces bilateralis CBS 781.70 TaxID=1392243 RepID=A0A6G1FRT0_9PEZI|nr:uncharacterized protein P152DRAFT_462556 [Eremomyces bilateralis CBS 781.70]KAF1808420.1 hypothetical protein P152DRAFT_462556 [Eremomyces bilateralis CBS 781.70]